MEEEKKNTLIEVHPALFILFSEYLGYVSKYIEEATSWCKGEAVKDEVKKFLVVEAKCIYRSMLKTFPINEIREWYDIYYPIIFQEYDENLKKENAK